ncbi:MAG: helix-hairpin-helix domain-containing protein [Clostridia bacterium]|nr:helix-hairpin-helix domain-containing protein [Clostridia bacterium]
MKKKIYYIFFAVFAVVSGVWYSNNHEELMLRHMETVKADNISHQFLTEDDEDKVSFVININTADIYDLSALEGIGEKKALNIVEYRKKNGKFTDINELLNVDGIGEVLLEKIKDRITLEE